MLDSSESFRNELAAKLFPALPQDHLVNVLKILDITLHDYDISRKPVTIIPKGGVPEVVKSFIACKAVKNLSPGTLKIYTLRLTNFFTMVQKPFQDISANDIRMYMYYYKDQRGASDAYLDDIRRILNSFFTWAFNNNWLLRNPCVNVEPVKYQKKQRVPLTSYELEVLRWYCESIREKALVDFFFSTGIRLSELCDANKSDINWDRRSMVVRHGKGDKRRVVFFNAEAELSLQKYLESRDDDNDALFVSVRRPHDRLHQKAIENIVTKVAKRANMHVYPHMLRHTFATSGLRGGMPLEKLQALMGHEKPETTLIYAKLDDFDLQREHQRVYV